MIVFIKRFFRRLRYAFQFYEMWTWRYESCRRCGKCYRLPCGIQEEIWLKVNGKSEGCLCFDCFIILAQEKNIKFGIKNIERLSVFNPKNGGFYIIEPTFKYSIYNK